MSLTIGGRFLFVRSPLVQTLRNRSRTPNLRKPAIPHWHRAVALKLTEPIYRDPEEDLYPSITCKKKEKILLKSQTQINPFEQILAREFLEKIANAKLVAIFHQLPMSEAELFATRLQLNKINMAYLKHNNNMIKLAFSGTKYESLLKLYESTTVTFAGDQLAVAKTELSSSLARYVTDKGSPESSEPDPSSSKE
ncbi:39S ribosomal protein L10-like [Homarus americanus]|uniref:39S ribosomal protein L10-like n=1 Tax=Homarus americanus TaxID=6706 RepID=A0A8J5T418_HOMAM|nr:39S ribosomal protein L10-like [Homarus americanus]